MKLCSSRANSDGLDILLAWRTNRISKALFYGELVGGQRSRGGQHKRYNNVLKYSLKACDIPFETWGTRF